MRTQRGESGPQLPTPQPAPSSTQLPKCSKLPLVPKTAAGVVKRSHQIPDPYPLSKRAGMPKTTVTQDIKPELCSLLRWQFLCTTTHRGGHCQCPHCIDEETTASEVTCPSSPKTKISSDVELRPCWPNSRAGGQVQHTKGPSPGSLLDVSPDRQARPSASGAAALLPGEETVFCLWPGLQHTHRQLPTGHSLPC